MYKNIYIENQWSPNPTVHIWDDKQGYFKERFQNYSYILDEYGSQKSIYGDPVKKKNYISKEDKAEAKKKYGAEHVTFETDVRASTRYLVDRYLNDDEPSKGHTILFFDIEVSMEGEMPDVQTANQPITSVAYYDTDSEEKVVMIWDQNDKLNETSFGDVEVIPFDTEEDLLVAFVEAWRDINPSIVVGYNSDWFDIPYTYRRLRKVFSESFANKLSPIDIVDYNERKDKFTIAGVSSLDYLQLYKNFTFSQLDSYSLDSVSNHELSEGKIEYKGREYEVDGETKVVSDLDDLFEYDLERFVEYNMEDVMLLVKLDEKLDFIELARKICHLGHVPYEDIYMSSRYIDGAILTWLHRRGIVAPDTRNFDINLSKDHKRGSKELTFTNDIPLHIPPRGVLGIKKTTSKKEQYEYVSREGNTLKLKNRVDFHVKKDMKISLEFPGAFVKSPVPGRYEWIYDLDLTSMYPSIIMTINISPETKVGRVFGWNAEKALQENDGDKEYDVYLFDRHEMTRMKKRELVKSLKENDLAIASNGAFYRTDKKGVIPSILEDWFTLRQKYKGTRNEWREKATKISDEEGGILPGEDEEDLEKYNSKAAYYDKLQHVHKILINSVYGVLGLSSFRYYDVDNAQAVTDTGRTLIKFTSTMGDNWYNNALDTEDVKSYNVKLDDGSVREIKPTERVKVIRDGIEQRVFGCNLIEGDEII